MSELEELVSNLNELMINPHKRPEELLEKLEDFGVVFNGDEDGWIYDPEKC